MGALPGTPGRIGIGMPGLIPGCMPGYMGMPGYIGAPGYIGMPGLMPGCIGIPYMGIVGYIPGLIGMPIPGMGPPYMGMPGRMPGLGTGMGGRLPPGAKGLPKGLGLPPLNFSISRMYSFCYSVVEELDLSFSKYSERARSWVTGLLRS
jgi:hypothetical protein